MLLALAVSALLASQLPPSPEANVLPPPAGGDETPLDQRAPLPDPSASSPPAPPPVPAPAPVPDDKPARPEPPSGMSQPATAAVQIAVGTGACCAGCCAAAPFTLGLALVPVVGGVAGAVAADLIIGGTIGVAETWAGDAWGQGRAPVLWPVAASAGMLLASTAFTTVATILEPPVLVPVPTDGDPKALLDAIAGARQGPLTRASSYVRYAACVGAIVLPAVVYALTETPKKPGDHGQGLPGLTSPADPVPVPRPAAPAGATVAMLF